MATAAIRYVNDLHIFPHKDAYLVFHPESFSLFRIGDVLANMLQELKNGAETESVAERYGASTSDLDSKLLMIQNKIEREMISAERARTKWQDRSAPRDRAIHLTIHVSNACNLDCVYCYAQGGDYGRETRVRMDKSLAVKAIDVMYRNFRSITAIMFFGGEPTLALDVIETICNHIDAKHARGEIESVPDYTMITNGTLITDEAIRVIRSHKIATTISVDGPKELNDKLRPDKGGKGSYDKVKEGFDRIVNEVGQLPQIEATYTKAHEDAGLSMEGLIEFLHKEFMFTIGTVATVSVPDDHPLALVKEKAQNEVSSAFNNLTRAIANGELPKMEKSFLDPILQFLDKKGTRFHCSVGHDGFAVTTEGDIYPCQIFIGQEQFLMGTVDDFDMENPSPRFQNAVKYMTYRDKDLNPICRECWVKAFCFSCPGSNTFSSNNYQIPEAFCRTMRSWMENVLALLYEIKSDPVMWKKFLDGIRKISDDAEKSRPGGLADFAPPPGHPSLQPTKPKLYQIQGAS